MTKCGGWATHEEAQAIPMTTITDPALNAAVSTAIIDRYAGVVITLTGAGNSQTLQNPTDATEGKQFVVVADDANGAHTIVVNGVTLAAGEAQEFIWDGSAWVIVTAADKVNRITSVDNEIARFDGTSGDIQGYSSNAPTITDDGLADFPGGLEVAAAITLAQLVWLRGNNFAGSDYINMFKVNADDEIDCGGTLNISAVQAAEDSGAIVAMDMPVSAASAAGAEMSYSYQINGDTFVKVYAESDGVGGIQNKAVKISEPLETIDNVLHVAKNGLDSNTGGVTDPFLTIKAAVASITDNDSTHRYCIMVGPGIFTEDNPIQMKAYVNIVGSGAQTATKVIASNSASDIFLCAEYAALKDMELEGATTGSAIACSVAGSTYHQDVTVVNCQTGLKVNHANAQIGMYNFNLLTHTGGTITNGILIESGKADIRNLYNIEDSALTNFIKTIGANSSVKIWSAVTESANVTNGLFADQSSKITAIDCEVNYCTNGVRAENSGYISARNCMFYDSVYDIYLATNGEYGGHASCLSRDKIYNDGTGIIHSFGCDYSRKIFRSLADLSVGLPFQGHSLWAGEGGPYEDGVKVVTFDGGTTYADVTDSSTIQFPNNNVGTCIYFGDINPYSWFGLQYLMGSAKLSGGSVEWQYYDGGTSSWVKINTLNTINGHSDSYNSESFIGDNDVIQAVRFDQDIVDGVTESNAGATGWVNTTINGDAGKWIRCIITGGITTSPIFQTVRLKGHFMTIRENGTTAYNGEARVLVNQVLPFGDSGSGGASATLNVSSNISYPYWNNSLANSGTPALYFRFVINETVDTSCGLVLKCIRSTSHNEAANRTAKITTYSSRVKSGDAFDGANAEVSQSNDFVYTSGDAAGLIHECALTDRIDISDMKEDDVVYVKYERDSTHVDDDLTSNVDYSNVWVEYRKWGEGKCLI